jgi:hypothetical protein
MISFGNLSRAVGGAAALFLLAAAPVKAAQFVATADFNGGGAVAGSYVGPGNFTSAVGWLNDGGRDAFDGYGRYLGGASGITLQRRSELIAGTNVFRFFDSFTNTTAGALTFDVDFFGFLGSDVLTKTLYDDAGVLVTCQAIGGACTHDPVIASVAGTLGLVSQTLSGSNTNQYDAVYRLTLSPGQTASLLNFAFLASDLAATKPSDVTLAEDTGKFLAAHPMLDGLSDAQIASVVNFDLGVASAVPEPAAWATMLCGLAFVGAMLRRWRGLARPAGA